MTSTRRHNGEGSICRVSDNKWIAKISLGTSPNGKTIMKQFSGKTETIVKKKLKEFKKSPYFTEKHLPSQETVKSYFSMWLREYQFNKLKPSSYDRLESTVTNHILPHIGGMKIDKVTRDNIQALINRLYVIVNNKGKPVLPSNFERSFHTILKKAGIDGDYGIHALRHTFASMLFAKGVDVKIVSKILGHSSVKITYDIYVHLFDKDVSRVTMVLD